jgi:hypothetical protein
LKNETKSPHNPAITLPFQIPKELKAKTQTDMCISMFIAYKMAKRGK